MRRILIALPILILSLLGCNRHTPKSKLETHLDTVSYCLGVLQASNLKQEGFDTINTTFIGQGYDDYVNQGKTLINKNKARQIILDEIKKSKEKKLLVRYRDNKIKGENFLSENAKRNGVNVLPSGLQYEVLKTGHGEQPDSNDVVYVHYRGELVDGTVFEDNFKGDSSAIPVNRVIPGWTEALLHMHVGDRWKIFIPYQLAYGSQLKPNSPILPYSTLIFEIQLLKVQK